MPTMTLNVRRCNSMGSYTRLALAEKSCARELGRGVCNRKISITPPPSYFLITPRWWVRRSAIIENRWTHYWRGPRTRWRSLLLDTIVLIPFKHDVLDDRIHSAGNVFYRWDEIHFYSMKMLPLSPLMCACLKGIYLKKIVQLYFLLRD